MRDHHMQLSARSRYLSLRRRKAPKKAAIAPEIPVAATATVAGSPVWGRPEAFELPWNVISTTFSVAPWVALLTFASGAA